MEQQCGTWAGWWKSSCSSGAMPLLPSHLLSEIPHLVRLHSNQARLPQKACHKQTGQEHEASSNTTTTSPKPGVYTCQVVRSALSGRKRQETRCHHVSRVAMAVRRRTSWYDWWLFTPGFCQSAGPSAAAAAAAATTITRLRRGTTHLRIPRTTESCLCISLSSGGSSPRASWQHTDMFNFSLTR